ncbi:MAG: ATP-binding protein [Promethearchaeota archaeon]
METAGGRAETLDLINSLPISILVVDENSTVLFVNPEAERFFETDKGELLGSEFKHQIVGQNVSEIEVRTGAGTRVAEMLATPVVWGGKNAFLLSLRDVTELKRTRAALLRKQTHDRVVNEIATNAVVVEDLEKFLRDSLATCGHGFGVTRLTIYHICDDGTDTDCGLEVVQTWGRSGEGDAGSLRRRINPKGLDWILEPMTNDETRIFVEGGARECHEKLCPIEEPDTPTNIETILAIPLSLEACYYGFLSVEDEQADRVWNDDDLDVLKTVATILVQVISRFNYKERLEELVEERTRELKNTVDRLEGEVRVREETEVKLREAMVAAESANKAKSDFLATMSHELRTPLNSVIGFSEVLQDEILGPLNGEQKDAIDKVLGAGRHLLSLINDILDLSKVEAGKVDLNVTRFDLRKHLERVTDILGEKASSKGMEVPVVVEPDGLEVDADERKFRQIMFNLLDNAIKYTPAGGKVGIRAVSVDGGVEVTVWDSGIGIPKESQDQLFQPFTRIKSDASENQPGTGLGLHYTKKLVELHGGRIWVDSARDSGAKFTFFLPQPPTCAVPNGESSQG